MREIDRKIQPSCKSRPTSLYILYTKRRGSTKRGCPSKVHPKMSNRPWPLTKQFYHNNLTLIWTVQRSTKKFHRSANLSERNGKTLIKIYPKCLKEDKVRKNIMKTTARAPKSWVAPRNSPKIIKQNKWTFFFQIQKWLKMLVWTRTRKQANQYLKKQTAFLIRQLHPRARRNCRRLLFLRERAHLHVKCRHHYLKSRAYSKIATKASRRIR